MDTFWNKFPGCACLKSILINSGFDNRASLKCMNSNLISEIEKDVENDRSFLENLTCDHKNRYLNHNKFEFIPGHRALIIDWCENDLNSDDRNDVFDKNHPAFSYILKELIDSAMQNYKKHPNTRRYSNKLKDFCIFLYIMAGRACYETLSENLPIPKAGSICKYYCGQNFSMIG